MKRNKFGDIYYSLIGGGVDLGETPEQALIREVKEEASMSLAGFRKVFIESAGVGLAINIFFYVKTLAVIR